MSDLSHSENSRKLGHYGQSHKQGHWLLILEKWAKIDLWGYLIIILIFLDETFGKASSWVYRIPGVKKIQKTVKLKEFDELGIFFRKAIYSFLKFWSKTVNSLNRFDLYPND